jgi:AcrR family transcriptional regulator
VSPRVAQYVDRDTVIQTAAELADRDGWHALTMSQVAKELDRHVSSLYAHVESLAELRREVALLALDELTDDVWRAALGKVKSEALHAIADVYFEYASKHPGRGAATIDTRHDEEVAAKGARLAEPIWATLRSFGLDDERQVKVAHSVFSATVTGLARRGNREALRQAVALFVVGLESGEWPS